MWIQEIGKYSNGFVKVMLVGNKADLWEKRVVLTDEGEMLAHELGVRFLETSARSACNIEKAFQWLINDMVEVALSAKALSSDCENRRVSLNPAGLIDLPGQVGCC